MFCLLDMSSFLLTFVFAVFESFKDYVATEQLDGDNKYDAGEHGLQVRIHFILIICVYCVKFRSGVCLFVFFLSSTPVVVCLHRALDSFFSHWSHWCD